MIKLFIESIPEDLDKLEAALKNKDAPMVAKLAHHMKSSLSMFKLDKEVEFLTNAEQNAKASIVNDETLGQFGDFQISLVYVIGILIAMNVP
jgi:HPt (histidine-containing phosphotransfer) domain-containing protein